MRSNLIGLKKRLAFSTTEKRSLIEQENPALSIASQCSLLKLPRSTFYFPPKLILPEKSVTLMHNIDEIYTDFPYYGGRKIKVELVKRFKKIVGRKTIRKLMRIMGLEAIYPKPNTSKPNQQHATYPYLLKGIIAAYSNHIWGTDITYIRAGKYWFYLSAILDWHSRYVVSWTLSENIDTALCLETLEKGLAIAKPLIHNSDQGSTYTAEEYLNHLKQAEVQISMDGVGRCMDNIFTERLWRTVKYEEVYLHAYGSFKEAMQSLKLYFNTYNEKRVHQALEYRTPAEVYFK